MCIIYVFYISSTRCVIATRKLFFVLFLLLLLLAF